MYTCTHTGQIHIGDTDAETEEKQKSVGDKKPSANRLVKRFGAYDSDTLQPFLSRRLSAWYTQFPVTGPAAWASDSDTQGWGGGGAPGARVATRAQTDQRQRKRRPSLMSDAPPLMQPYGEIKRLHVTCLARRAAPLQAAAEIAQSARGQGHSKLSHRLRNYRIGYRMGHRTKISHATSHDIACYITCDIAITIVCDIAS